MNIDSEDESDEGSMQRLSEDIGSKK